MRRHICHPLANGEIKIYSDGVPSSASLTHVRLVDALIATAVEERDRQR